MGNEVHINIWSYHSIKLSVAILIAVNEMHTQKHSTYTHKTNQHFIP